MLTIRTLVSGNSLRRCLQTSISGFEFRITSRAQPDPLLDSTQVHMHPLRRGRLIIVYIIGKRIAVAVAYAVYTRIYLKRRLFTCQ